MEIDTAGIRELIHYCPHEDSRCFSDFRGLIFSRPPLCAYCGRLADAGDHIFPASLYDWDCRDNLQALCRQCNMAKSSSIFALFPGQTHAWPLVTLHTDGPHLTKTPHYHLARTRPNPEIPIRICATYSSLADAEFIRDDLRLEKEPVEIIECQTCPGHSRE